MPANTNPLSALLSFLNLENFTYFPTTGWEHFFNPQIGVFNTFAANPEDKPVEAAVLQRVGSYGSQLSTILSAVGMLCDHIDPKTLSSSDKRAVQKLKLLRSESKETVALYKGEFDVNDADRFLDYLARMKEENPPLFESLKRRLDQASSNAKFLK